MNWGTKIVSGMIAFMLFIIGMVVYMFTVHGNDPLVAEDYYEKGINYNQEFNAIQNVSIDRAQPKITISKFQVIVQLKDHSTYELKMMRPSSKKEDVLMKGSTIGDSNLILIDTKKMHRGVWFMELSWKNGSKNYLFKNDIVL
ncbi:FixH family protein [Pedobacter insulae]|uniref:FixH protein n=1 Tax=Pedobacter insulae TaxID=414048 RepID=A0A1I3A340_9SPHI|nr:FixH family protein [Pedobacter insulae]SFH43731.1 hypothetical protein SAMN04489864_11285 [Pedobacter insulae]